MTKKLKTYDLNSADLRQVINDRMTDLDISTYLMGKHAGMTCSRGTVYRYLSGKGEISSVNLEQVLKACGLGLVVLDKDPEWMYV